VNSLAKEVILIKKRFFENFIRSSGHMLHHMVIVGLSAGLALALPLAVRLFWKAFLTNRSLTRGKMEEVTNKDSESEGVPKNNSGEENGTSSSPWTCENDLSTGDFSIARQNIHRGLHPRGKEVFLLRSKSPICEKAGWIAFL
jgi:hypothetical protein